MVSDKEARDILEVRANLAEKVPAEKWDTLVADIVGDEDYSFYEEAEYDPLFPGDPGYEAALAEQERMNAEYASATKALPFREELKNALVTLLDELQTKAIAQAESKAKVTTHAAHHVRTAAGVRRFRQSMNSIIKRDLVPETPEVPVVDVVDALPDPYGGTAVESNKHLADHVRQRVKEARKTRGVEDEDVALKMEANATLHPIILEKLRATDAGRAWLEKNSVPDLKRILADNGFTHTGINGIPKMREHLIALDANASSYTEEENNIRADQLIAYILGGDSFVQKEFEDARDSNFLNDDAYYGMGLVNHIWQGKTSKGFVTLTDGDIERIGRIRDHLDQIGPEYPTISEWTRKCIDTWASTAFDTNSLSIAMQATAETIYGGDSNVTRFPHVDEKPSAEKKKLADKVDRLITDHAPFLAAFVTSVYERTQESLKVLDSNDRVRVYRGMQIAPSLIGGADRSNPTQEDLAEFKKTFWPDYLKKWMAETPLDEQVTRYQNVYEDKAPLRLARKALDEFMTQKYGHGIRSNDFDTLREQGTVVFQPLSACATSYSSAANFTSMFGSGTTPNAEPMLFTLDIPKERIWSIPTHGPGCLGEDEVIVLGGQYQADIQRFGGGMSYTIDEQLDDLGVEAVFLEMIDAEVGKQVKAGIPKTEWEQANQEWYDKIGTTVNSGIGLATSNGTWDLWDEIPDDKKYGSINLGWYYMLRSQKFPVAQALAMAEAVYDKKSKQKVGKPVYHDPDQKPAHKKAAAAPVSFGESMTDGYDGGGPGPGLHHMAHKKPWKKAAKKLLPKKKPPVKAEDIPMGFLSSGKPKALAPYTHYGKRKYGAWGTYYGKPVPKAVKDAIVAQGWTSNVKGTMFYPPDYEQKKYEFEHAVWVGSTDPNHKKAVEAWRKTLPDGITYAEACALYGSRGSIKVVGGSTIKSKLGKSLGPQAREKLRILGWDQGTPSHDKATGHFIWTYKRTKKDAAPPKPPKKKPVKKLAAMKTATKMDGKTPAQYASYLNEGTLYSKKNGSKPSPFTVTEKAFLTAHGYVLVDGLWKKKAIHKKLVIKKAAKKS